MACDAIKFIPTRTSRVMASQGGSRRKRAEGKEMPARSSEEQAGRGRGKSGGHGLFGKAFSSGSCELQNVIRVKAKCQERMANGLCLPGWLVVFFSHRYRYRYRYEIRIHTFAHTPIRTRTLATCSFGPTKVGRESCKMHLFEFVPEPPAEKWEMVWQLPKVGRQSTTTTTITTTARKWHQKRRRGTTTTTTVGEMCGKCKKYDDKWKQREWEREREGKRERPKSATSWREKL